MSSRTEQYALERLGSVVAQPDLAELITRALRERADHAFVRALVEDERRRPPAEPLPVVQAPPGEGVVTGNDGAGWTNCPSIDSWRPPGIGVIDRMMDVEDAVAKADRIRRLGGG